MKEREIAIVTGGSGGIGRCTAMSLAKAGCKVYELSRHAKEGTPGVEHLTADMTDEASVQAAVAEVERREGRIDILVCNAGFGISGAAEYTSPDDAHAQLELNLYGADRAARAVIPVMRAQGGGRIVCMSSIAGILPIPFQLWYSVSKAAINAYVLALQNEVRPFASASVPSCRATSPRASPPTGKKLCARTPTAAAWRGALRRWSTTRRRA